MTQLTERQAQVLDYIKRYHAKYGYAPSVRAIADRFDMAVNAVAGHLRALEAKRAIRRTPGVARSIVVLEKK